MAGDIQGTVRDVLINALENAGKSTNGGSENGSGKGSGKSHIGMKGLAAGVGAAALAPIALKGIGKLADELGIDALDVIKSPEHALEGVTSNLTERVKSGIGDQVHEKVDEAGGPGGILKDTIKGALPGGGGGGGTKGGAMGVGKGRRMPVQQEMDIGLPLETVYNQFTQFELWPQFMHRVNRATQEDDCTVSFTAKIWTRSREFKAEIETQHPDERIKWRVTEGIAHTGVVTFHELGPNLTRVLVGFDVQPGGMIEKFARGARHIKRASRGDLHRFKAFIEMQEFETGAWRGVIEDGEVVEEHDPSYDKGRPYSDPEATLAEPEDDDSNDDDSNDDEKEKEKGEDKPARSRSRSSNGARSSNGRSRSGSSSAATSASSSSRQASGGGRGSSKRATASSSGSSRGASRRSSSGTSKRSSSPRSSSGSSGRSSASKTRGRQTRSRAGKNS